MFNESLIDIWTKPDIRQWSKIFFCTSEPSFSPMHPSTSTSVSVCAPLFNRAQRWGIQRRCVETKRDIIFLLERVRLDEKQSRKWQTDTQTDSQRRKIKSVMESHKFSFKTICKINPCNVTGLQTCFVAYGHRPLMLRCVILGKYVTSIQSIICTERIVSVSKKNA